MTYQITTTEVLQAGFSAMGNYEAIKDLVSGGNSLTLSEACEAQVESESDFSFDDDRFDAIFDKEWAAKEYAKMWLAEAVEGGEGHYDNDDNFILGEENLEAIFEAYQKSQMNYCHVLEVDSVEDLKSTIESCVDAYLLEGFSQDQIYPFLSTLDVHYIGEDDDMETEVEDFNLSEYILDCF
jgi:hypothetical protein